MNYLSCKVIFFCQKKEKKSKNLHFFTNVFVQKIQENKFMIQKTQKDDLAKRKVILFITGILIPSAGSSISK
mgnify:CR=1 FL=1|jgi:hypothetical protein